MDQIPQKTNVIHSIGQGHDVNQYRFIEQEIKQLKNELNNRSIENGGSKLMLENKKDSAINWTYSDPTAFELVRKVAKHRDPQAAAELARNIPEFKGMMEDIAELGAAPVREHIKILHKDMSVLERNKNELEDHNNKLDYEINQMNDKIHNIELQKTLLETKIEEVEEEFKEKQNDYENLNNANYHLKSENEQLNDLTEKYKRDIDGLELVLRKTKENMDRYINEEVDLKTKIQQLDDILNLKQNEIEKLNKLKEDVETKAEEEKGELSQKLINSKNETRKSKLKLMIVTDLKKIVKDKSKLYTGMLKSDLLKIIYEQEGLNEIPVENPEFL